MALWQRDVWTCSTVWTSLHSAIHQKGTNMVIRNRYGHIHKMSLSPTMFTLDKFALHCSNLTVVHYPQHSEINLHVPPACVQDGYVA